MKKKEVYFQNRPQICLIFVPNNLRYLSIQFKKKSRYFERRTAFLSIESHFRFQKFLYSI